MVMLIQMKILSAMKNLVIKFLVHYKSGDKHEKKFLLTEQVCVKTDPQRKRDFLNDYIFLIF